MPANVEVKARATDVSALRARLEAAAVEPPSISEQEDTFFNVWRGRLKMCCDAAGKCELIYYRRDSRHDSVVSAYFRQPLADPKAKHEELRSLFGVKSFVKKTRAVYKVQGARIHLDHVDTLGDFIEIEVPIGGRLNAHRASHLLHRLLENLKIPEYDVVKGAYDEMAGVRNEDR
jgi:predicted adenylyl cyclase CyaB